MKYFLSFLMMLSFATAFSQQMQIVVSARNDSITVSGEDDNNDKLFVIKPAFKEAANDYLTVIVSNEKISSNWSRKFYIRDEANKNIAELKPMRKNEYCITMKEITSKLETNKQYKLYTIINPQDQTKAGMVKIPPLLVCAIKLSAN